MNDVSLQTIAEVMKWPLLACLLLPPLLVYLGLHVVKREIIFVDLALAQVATLGTCIAPFFGYDFHDPIAFWIALALTLVAAAFFSWSRGSPQHNIPQEAVIGITFVVSAAAVIVLLSKVPGGREELEHLLAGDILNVTAGGVLQRALLFGLLSGFYAAIHPRLALITTDPQAAVERGWSVRSWDFLFYSAFGLIVVSFVKLAGVLLTFSYLIVPAVCGVLLARGWPSQLAAGWGTSFAASVLGLFLSYVMDLPTGATIVCTCGLILIAAATVAHLRRN